MQQIASRNGIGVDCQKVQQITAAFYKVVHCVAFCRVRKYTAFKPGMSVVPRQDIS